jgi:AcrR family transcriptional regulator
VTTLPAAAPSRRELNKTATREAIATAALDFLRTRDIKDFTVDDVANAAGVSRRTFFNYFSSVEAAVASFTERYLDSLIVELQARPAVEPILESAAFALSAVGSPRDLAVLAETYTLTQDPQLARFQLQTWDECGLKITEVIGERLPAVVRERLPASTGDMYIHALVGAIIGSCRAAFQVWFSERGTDTGPESLARLRELLTEAVTLLRQGFTN